jgi:hypothetical protein
VKGIHEARPLARIEGEPVVLILKMDPNLLE